MVRVLSVGSAVRALLFDLYTDYLYADHYARSFHERACWPGTTNYLDVKIKA
jgi:hypothetical protein